MSGDQLIIYSERPESLRVALGWPCAPSVSFQICGNNLVQHADECLSATFQCSARPFETLLIFTRNEWGPAYCMHSCQKQSKQPKSLRVAVAWPCARACVTCTSVSVKISGAHVATHSYLSATFQCSARAFETFWIFTWNEWGPPYYKYIYAAARSNQNGQSLWQLQLLDNAQQALQSKVPGEHVIFECHISIQIAMQRTPP